MTDYELKTIVSNLFPAEEGYKTSREYIWYKRKYNFEIVAPNLDPEDAISVVVSRTGQDKVQLQPRTALYINKDDERIPRGSLSVTIKLKSDGIAEFRDKLKAGLIKAFEFESVLKPIHEAQQRERLNLIAKRKAHLEDVLDLRRRLLRYIVKGDAASRIDASIGVFNKASFKQLKNMVEAEYCSTSSRSGLYEVLRFLLVGQKYETGFADHVDDINLDELEKTYRLVVDILKLVAKYYPEHPTEKNEVL